MLLTGWVRYPSRRATCSHRPCGKTRSAVRSRYSPTPGGPVCHRSHLPFPADYRGFCPTKTELRFKLMGSYTPGLNASFTPNTQKLTLANAWKAQKRSYVSVKNHQWLFISRLFICYFELIYNTSYFLTVFNVMYVFSRAEMISIIGNLRTPKR